MNIEVFLSVISLVVISVLIVTLSSEACFLDLIYPPNEVSNDVAIQKCLNYNADLDLGCYQYVDWITKTSYKPKFQYDGSRCVSAFLSTYIAPLLTFLMISSPLSAFIDLIIVPRMALWCYLHQHSSFIAKHLFTFLRSISFTVPFFLFKKLIPSQETDDNDDNNNDNLTSLMTINYMHYYSSILRQSYVNLYVTLFVSMTYGLVSPLIGAVCLLSVCLQYKHRKFLLTLVKAAQLYNNSQNSQPQDDDDIELNKSNYFAFNWIVSKVIFGSVCGFWIFCIVYYLNELTVIYSILVGVAIACLIAFVFSRYITCHEEDDEQEGEENKFRNSSGIVSNNDVDNVVLNDSARFHSMTKPFLENQTS
jgi:hypothetical protein